VFFLIDGDHFTRVIEDHEARAGCALIDRGYVLRHIDLLD
jgi:hypothetical protein